MKNVRVIALAFFGSVFFLSGCAGMEKTPVMPKDFKGERITSIDQFKQVLSQAEGRKGKAIQLAGRLRTVQETQDGYKVFASWLPYPSEAIEDGPRDDQTGPVPNFLFYFHGKVKEKVFTIVQGNTFILDGTVKGTEKAVVNILGEEKDLLTVSVECVRIWETGTSSPGSGRSMDYPGEIARTFCSQK